MVATQATQFKTKQERNAAMMKALATLLQQTGSTQDKIISSLKLGILPHNKLQKLQGWLRLFCRLFLHRANPVFYRKL